MRFDRRAVLTGSASALLTGTTYRNARAENDKAPWAFLYWMPYDNDLAPHAEPILRMLAEGVRQSPAVVAVQTDTAGDHGMRRFLITRAGVQRSQVPAYDSASGEELAQFLEWASRELPADNYVVTVLGHGGTLTELGEDRSTQGWLKIDDVTAALDRLRAASGKRPALLYLQNCNKGTIENYYALRDCAHVTLAAQSLLGAPNYYYQPMLGWIASNYSSATPMSLARTVVESERPDMFATLVGTDNFKLHELPQRLKPLLEAVRASRIPSLQRHDIITYEYPEAGGELHTDFIRLLAGLSTRLDSVRPHYMQFSTWLWNTMGVRRGDGTLTAGTLVSGTLHGIGMAMPRNTAEYERYRSLPFHAATRFWDYVPYRIAEA